MLLVVVWIVVAVLVLAVLGGLLHGLLGAFQRLGREVDAFGRELGPVLELARDSAERAARLRADQEDAG
ncbi:hypothetical protein OF117_07035 [Geodermatophilus sp. YIM 151500]|uniref:hypothetical protein n=1 Tax=Geodermatophilus sp. YIM 151500 TaxID=2984531 RepID=UPI0021E469FD|nr:hypothetical protein [Geodermatophilus sp. YIM 151500]MCV2489114.1 hypothetical protein [Geodermatophilus sp. YIM 151500]